MAVIRSLTITIDLKTTESLEEAPAAASAAVVSKDFNRGARQFAYPALKKLAAWKPSITSASSGPALLEIDLLALPGTQGEFSAEGLQLQIFRLHNPTGNAGSVTLRPALIDGYDIFGEDSSVTVEVGCEVLKTLGDEAPVVGDFSGATSRYLELDGLEGDQYELELVFG